MWLALLRYFSRAIPLSLFLCLQPELSHKDHTVDPSWLDLDFSAGSKLSRVLNDRTSSSPVLVGASGLSGWIMASSSRITQLSVCPHFQQELYKKYTTGLGWMQPANFSAGLEFNQAEPPGDRRPEVVGLLLVVRCHWHIEVENVPH